ncbi:gamma-glutamyltranspeptidase [Wilcoxina mikolae CBS 423.85]|nr:gamma-glutamyltranspeptidase [Wilcoxina mikolae CBS 423.85]
MLRKNLHALAKEQPPFVPFPSRRSVVHSTNGIVSCTQPLAAQAGLRILREGGNAADAAVAVAAALNVTEPTSTGIGGDMFCLFYSATSKSIRGLNGSGRSPAALTLNRARSDLGMGMAKGKMFVDAGGSEVVRIPMNHVHAVTVPGAAAGWVDVVERFGSGKVRMKEVLKDAIRLAEEGCPVSELSARFWAECEGTLKGPNQRELLKGGERPPRVGEIMKMPGLARVFRGLAEEGKRAFYEGRVAREIVEAVKRNGGVMELEDLRKHGRLGSEEMEPISLDYAGVKVWECAPNGQGIVALMTLGILEAMEKNGDIKALGGGAEGWGHNQTEYLHAVIEALRIAFSDGHWWVADPAITPVPVSGLLDKSYLSTRASLFNPSHMNPSIHHGTPAFQSTDTVYFSVTDSFGNGCSFINSTFGGFGSGIIPKDCGFVLQNRGSGFSLIPGHPNALAPGKRPYHTIIPGLLTDLSGKELKAVFGCMGGFMQPQGHVQILLNTLRCGMDPQAALDAPRISIGTNYDPGAFIVHLEEGIPEEVVEGLRRKGHTVEVVREYGRGMFGRGQVIAASEDEGKRVWSAGSDMRGDGQAVGY